MTNNDKPQQRVPAPADTPEARAHAQRPIDAIDTATEAFNDLSTDDPESDQPTTDRGQTGLTDF